MKTTKIIAKIVVALAAIAGAVYVIATYGNQIVAWCKKILASLPCCECKCTCECEEAEVPEEAGAEEAPVVEEATEEAAIEEAPAEEAAAEESAAEESDFEN